MSTIDDAWRRMERRLGGMGIPIGTIATVKDGFVLGVYTAASAMIAENATSQDISEAAERVERRR